MIKIPSEASETREISGTPATFWKSISFPVHQENVWYIYWIYVVHVCISISTLFSGV